MVEMCCDMLADEVREKIGKGQEIDKPQSKSYFRLVNGGICYTIGNAGNESPSRSLNCIKCLSRYGITVMRTVVGSSK